MSQFGARLPERPFLETIVERVRDRYLKRKPSTAAVSLATLFVSAANFLPGARVRFVYIIRSRG